MAHNANQNGFSVFEPKGGKVKFIHPQKAYLYVLALALLLQDSLFMKLKREYLGYKVFSLMFLLQLYYFLIMLILLF